MRTKLRLDERAIGFIIFAFVFGVFLGLVIAQSYHVNNPTHNPTIEESFGNR